MGKGYTYDPIAKIWHGPVRTPLYNLEGNLGHTILQRLAQHPTNIFQVCDDTGAEFTNFEIYKRSLKFANHLQKLGVKQHDVVGFVAVNTENVAPLIFACFSLGASVNPLSVLMNEQDIAYHWTKVNPKVVFCDAKMHPIVSKAFNQMEANVHIFTLIERVNGYLFADDILEEPYDIDEYDFPELPNISSTIALIMCSSGTTGMPKGVCKSHKQVLSTYHPFFKRSTATEDVAFCTVSSYWISHTLFLVNSALYGLKFVITSIPCVPDLWMDIIDRHKVTIVCSVPAFITVLLKSNKLRQFETLKTVIVTGCPIPQHFIENVKPLIPNGQVYCCYGTTESDIITHAPIVGQKDKSSGLPARNYSIKIVDDNENPLGPNEMGGICYKSPVEFPGYFNDPENTGMCFDADNFLKSGDLGYFDDDGHLFVVDRIKHLIKSKEGFRVTPGEIEIIIDEIDGVLQSSVVGVEDKEQFIDFIYAFVIKKPGATDLTEKFIMDYVNERVIDAKEVSGVIFIDKFPATPSGKIIIRQLKTIAMKFHEETFNKSSSRQV